MYSRSIVTATLAVLFSFLMLNGQSYSRIVTSSKDSILASYLDFTSDSPEFILTGQLRREALLIKINKKGNVARKFILRDTNKNNLHRWVASGTFENGNIQEFVCLSKYHSFENDSMALINLMSGSGVVVASSEPSIRGNVTSGQFLFKASNSKVSPVLFLIDSDRLVISELNYDINDGGFFESVMAVNDTFYASGATYSFISGRPANKPKHILLTKVSKDGIASQVTPWSLPFINPEVSSRYFETPMIFGNDIDSNLLISIDFSLDRTNAGRGVALVSCNRNFNPIWCKTFSYQNTLLSSVAATTFGDTILTAFEYIRYNGFGQVLENKLILAYLSKEGNVIGSRIYNDPISVVHYLPIMAMNNGFALSTRYGLERFEDVPVGLATFDFKLHNSCLSSELIEIQVTDLPLPEIVEKEYKVTKRVLETTPFSMEIIDLPIEDDLCEDYAFGWPSDTVLCSGDALELAVPSDPNWGTSFYTTWQDDVTDQVRTIREPGVYAVDLAGPCCSWRDTITVVESSLTLSLPMDAEICADSAYLLSPQITTSDSIASFSWNVTATDTNLVLSDSGIYVATAQNSKGCIASDTFHLTVHPLPLALAGLDDTLCVGDSVQLRAQGSGQFSWSPPTGLSDPMGQNPWASPAVSTYYTLQVTDTNQCRNTDSVFINKTPAPAAQAGIDTAICAGEALTLIGKGSFAGRWQTHPDEVMNENERVTIIPAGMTELIYEVYDTVNQCYGRDTVAINTLTLPNIDAGADTGACIGESLTLRIASNGVLQLVQGQGSINGATYRLAVNAPTTVIFTTTSTDGCAAADTLLIEAWELPSLLATPDTSKGIGTTVKLTAQSNGSVTWFTTAWEAIGCVGCDTVRLSPTDLTRYYVTSTSPEGCIVTDSVLVNVIEVCTPLKIPNAFSPNSDGLNDTWQVFTLPESQTVVTAVEVYNRWGMQVHQSNEPAPLWNGLLTTSAPAPTAVYQYQITTHCLGAIRQVKGSVKVVR